MEFNMLYQAFINNNLSKEDAFSAANAYINCNLYLSDNPTQEDYNEAVKEEMTYWED